MEKKKLLGWILIVIAVVVVIINLAFIYPNINCVYAPWVFWLIALLCVVGWALLFFDVKIMHSEEPEA